MDLPAHGVFVKVENGVFAKVTRDESREILISSKKNNIIH